MGKVKSYYHDEIIKIGDYPMTTTAKNKIRFILQSFYSKRDINGNCYWMSHVTSTKTGNTLKFSTPHSSNARGQIKDLGVEWEEIHEAQDTEMAIRDFNRMEKFIDMHDSCKDPEVREAILALEKE